MSNKSRSQSNPFSLIIWCAGEAGLACLQYLFSLQNKKLFELAGLVLSENDPFANEIEKLALNTDAVIYMESDPIEVKVDFGLAINFSPIPASAKRHCRKGFIATTAEFSRQSKITIEA